MRSSSRGSSSRATGSFVGLALVALLAAGCGGAAEARGAAPMTVAASGGSGDFAAYAPPAPPSAPGSGGEAAATGATVPAEPTSLEGLEVAARTAGTDGDEQPAADDAELDVRSRELERRVESVRGSEFRTRTTVAQAQPQPAQTGGGQTTPAATTSDATDGSGPLLIYEAELYLAVNEIRQRQAEAIGVVREMGGFVARQDDTSIVLRVPARRFNEALAALERIGDVLHRTVQSHDVTEEFHDLDVRLRNALAIRDRLQQLLERAGNVQDSLVVERELERITTSIEQMRGRIRFLSDRIAFSTITLRFQGLPTETLGPASSQFRLPFPWLDQLGLSNLLDLSTAE